MRRTGQTSRNEGITLIELLVVLFIISALAGAMMPLFLQVRQRADLDVCLSNMRQVLIGLQMYTADCGVLPLHGAGWVGDDTGHTLQPGVEWAAAVLPYVGSEESFICPADPDRGEWHRSGIPCSWAYYYNEAAYYLASCEGSEPVPESPLLRCKFHLGGKHIIVLGRRDTSIEICSLRKYGEITVVCE